ncbi:uracil-DNA glycosylase family protein [Novacetimonas hansenii]|uniref:uracil-DNA glycosylase family protein n=1 Tax=Novacetimonas hansenii TaxID=436 RepID=UPI000789BF42|nr:uracil-DNA glycosylase family protein [Novacetimonas hansenii]RFP02099.1 uracil-DNA glycosylase [Novacetimonas hansenii]WEQ60016.1 uracil-DNA glycosylase family protein [Novacetimonas hansenii]
MTPPTDDGALERLVTEIRACTACANVLPLGPRPILHVSPTARILIASQAPGTRVHETGQSFNDASGDRLRRWLGIDRATFYDSARIAIMPMGMCYPGRLPKGGDCPPRRECAPLWRERVLALMPDIRLTLLVGSYAQNHVLGPGKVEDRVRHYRDYLPRFFPLPHPSWRTGAWERRSPWFGTDVLPALRREVHAFL